MIVRIYTADVRPLEDERLYNAGFTLADEARREKINTARFPKDRRLMLGAWLLLRQGLSELGISEVPEMQPGEKGKPRFDALPGVHFNLSHSGTSVLCALAEAEVGCDTEMVKESGLHIAERWFAPEERDYLLQLPPERQSGEFARIWTLKESFIKSVGLGLTLPLNIFRVVTAEGKRSLSGTGFSAADYTLCELSADSTYRYACCVAAPPADCSFEFYQKNTAELLPL